MKTTIFYENSFGIITQYTGEILEKKETVVTIKLSANQTYKFDLKANSDFLVVCKRKIKPIGVLNSEHYRNYWTSFDEKLRSDILKELEKNDNILEYWNGNNFLNKNKY